MQILSTPATTSATSGAAIPVSIQSAASLLAQSTVYSTTIDGHEYTADISNSDGSYVATVPNHLPTITASGSSLLLAEANLESTISLLV